MGRGERELFGDEVVQSVQDTAIDIYMARLARLSPCHFLLQPGYHQSERFRLIALYI